MFELCKDLECIVFYCVLCVRALATVCPCKVVAREEVLTREAEIEEERKWRRKGMENTALKEV